MTLKPTSKRMSAEDAFFLYFERPHTPLHVGSLGIFEGTIPVEKTREGLASRLHLIPRYRQRPVFPPLFGGYPSWEDDPTFDIDRHVRLLELPKPVSEKRLHEICAEIFSEPLPRDRPLWEMIVIQGLEGDRTAYVTKVHHCLVDGVSGVELTLAILDVSPTPPPPPVADPWEPKPLPTPAGSWLEGVVDQIANGMIAITEWQRDLLDPREALRLVSELSAAGRQVVTAAMQWPQPAPWNKPVGKDRRIGFVKMPFQEVRAIRSSLGGTVNDVVLTILGGALGRYLRSNGKLSEDARLRLMIPVNVRTEEQRGTMGNRVSMMLPQIPVGIQDPIARLNAIRSEMDTLKASDQGAAFDRLLGLVENGPAAFSAIAGRVGMLPGMINLACTNVPGPLIPLYGSGHRMNDMFPLLPLAGDMGLGVAIMSYDQSLYWGITCDPKIVSNVDAIARLVEEELHALREAAGVPTSDLPETIGFHASPQPRAVATEELSQPAPNLVAKRRAPPRMATPVVASAAPAPKVERTSANGSSLAAAKAPPKRQSRRNMASLQPEATVPVKAKVTTRNGSRGSAKAQSRPLAEGKKAPGEPAAQAKSKPNSRNGRARTRAKQTTKNANGRKTAAPKRQRRPQAKTEASSR